MPDEKSSTCEGCGTEYTDPIMKTSLSIDERFCYWCALHRGEPELFWFRRNILSMRQDKRILAAETSLQAWAKQKPDDPADFEWYYCFLGGKIYGKKWADYVIELVGIPYKDADELGKPHLHASIANVPIQVESIGHAYTDTLYLCRARIFYKYSWAYLQFSYSKPVVTQIDIRNIKGADGEQLLKVQNGENLFIAVQQWKRGPEKGSILLTREECLKQLEKILADDPSMPQEDLAQKWGRSKFFRYRDEHKKFSKQDIANIRQKLLINKS